MASIFTFALPTEPHEIGTQRTKDGIRWAYPGSMLCSKLFAKKVTLVGWPDELRIRMPNSKKYTLKELEWFVNNYAFRSTNCMQIRKWDTCECLTLLYAFHLTSFDI